MSWEKVGSFIKNALPVLGSALGGPAGGAIGSVVSSVLGTDETPEAVLSKLQQDPDALSKLKQSELETRRDVLIASFQQQQNMLETVNKTIRNESNSDDPFVRRWRPFYGYCVSISWFVQMIGFAFVFIYVSITNPKELSGIIQQFAVLSGTLIGLWGIALTVLGVSVHKRSKDKAVGEQKAPGLIKTLIDR